MIENHNGRGFDATISTKFMGMKGFRRMISRKFGIGSLIERSKNINANDNAPYVEDFALAA